MMQAQSNDTASLASFRQVALLLEAMPARTHRVLLGQLDHDEILEVESHRGQIHEADAVEKLRVLKQLHDQLQQETQSVESVESEIQDEIQIGRARVSRKRAASNYRSGESSPSQRISEDPSPVDAMKSPSESGSKPSGSATDDGNATARNFAGHIQHPSAPTESPRQVDQDDAATTRPPTSTTHSAEPFDRTGEQHSVPPTPEEMQQLFIKFQQTQAAGVLPGPVPSSVHGRNVSEMDASRAMRPATEPTKRAWRDVIPFPTNRSEDAAEDASARGQWEAEELAARVDRFLTELPAKDLCVALGMVSTRQAFLVLCGLPNDTAETVLKMLPRKQARKVRGDMRKMGQLQLCEIDSAKQIVTQVAMQRTQPSRSIAA